MALTLEQRVAALEAKAPQDVIIIPLEPPFQKPPPAASLVFTDELGNKKTITTNSGTLADLCRKAGLAEDLVDAADKLGATSAKVDGDTLKAL